MMESMPEAEVLHVRSLSAEPGDVGAVCGVSAATVRPGGFACHLAFEKTVPVGKSKVKVIEKGTTIVSTRNTAFGNHSDTCSYRKI